jgi:hypothetical protein
VGVLAFGTLLTLFVIPAAYTLLSRTPHAVPVEPEIAAAGAVKA